ncbi:MAG: copper resistance protein [Verrucomicrobiota bacterium]
MHRPVIDSPTTTKNISSPKKEKFFSVGIGAHGVVAVGISAHGVVAIGVIAHGIVSIGVIAMGVLSTGLVSMGLLTSGLVAMGIKAAGPASMELMMDHSGMNHGDAIPDHENMPKAE